MHSLKSYKHLSNSHVIGHKGRVSALIKVVEGLLSGGKLVLTHLGRNLPGKGDEKHKIKCVDRLLGNTSLHEIPHRGNSENIAGYMSAIILPFILAFV